MWLLKHTSTCLYINNGIVQQSYLRRVVLIANWQWKVLSTRKNTLIIQNNRSFLLSNNKKTHLHFKPVVYRVTLLSKPPAAVSLRSDGSLTEGKMGGCQQECTTQSMLAKQQDAASYHVAMKCLNGHYFYTNCRLTFKSQIKKMIFLP